LPIGKLSGPLILRPETSKTLGKNPFSTKKTNKKRRKNIMVALLNGLIKGARMRILLK